MTREENRKLVEGLRPLLEDSFKAAMESGIGINVHASAEGTSWLDIGDYSLLISNGNMILEYRPRGKGWEEEWREDVQHLTRQKMSFAEILGENNERTADNDES